MLDRTLVALRRSRQIGLPCSAIAYSVRAPACPDCVPDQRSDALLRRGVGATLGPPQASGVLANSFADGDAWLA
jgi:hypothetical protein